MVAMESTIYSGLGLPSPANVECLDRCNRAIRDQGAVPALTAVLDGGGGDWLYRGWRQNRILASLNKLAARDLGHALATGVAVGVTTVSATLTIAGRAGSRCSRLVALAASIEGLRSPATCLHDLLAIARHRVATVSAGAKAFLDLPRTPGGT